MSRRAMAVAGIAVVCFWSGRLLAKDEASKVIVVERLVIRDSEGRTWAELGVSEKGICGLVLRDGSGHEMVRAFTNVEGSIGGLVVRDKAGQSRAEIVGGIEGAAVNLNDSLGQRRVHLLAAPDDEAESEIMVHGSKEAERVAFVAQPGKPAALRVRDDTGRVVWSAP